MKRAAMKRSTEPMKRTPMRRRSKKMEAKYAGDGVVEGRRALVERLLRERPVCEGGARIAKAVTPAQRRRVRVGEVVAADNVHRIGNLGVSVWKHCTLASTEVHEVLARSAGGSILDEKNCKTLCHRCHAWVGRNPVAATEVGLRESRYARAFVSRADLERYTRDAFGR